MMDSIKRFIECTIPISACNLKCDYCYVIQQNRRDSHMASFKISPQEMGNAFSRRRWEGTCYFSLCAFGETLLCKELVDIAYHILMQGHYVNITTNGTIAGPIDDFSKFPEELLRRLIFSFSFHYIELKKKNLLDKFISNVNKIRNAGCSVVVQTNLYDGYLPYLDEIKQICLNHFGALPQLALTRIENRDNLAMKYELFSDKRPEEYRQAGEAFDSALFDFTCKNFNVKRKEFCYAGDWTFKLDLASGNLQSCYFTKPHQNIYDDTNSPIVLKPVGNFCGSKILCKFQPLFIAWRDTQASLPFLRAFEKQARGPLV